MHSKMIFKCWFLINNDKTHNLFLKAIAALDVQIASPHKGVFRK